MSAAALEPKRPDDPASPTYYTAKALWDRQVHVHGACWARRPITKPCVCERKL